jgi:hypothetical protein
MNGYLYTEKSQEHAPWDYPLLLLNLKQLGFLYGTIAAGCTTAATARTISFFCPLYEREQLPGRKAKYGYDHDIDHAFHRFPYILEHPSSDLIYEK